VIGLTGLTGSGKTTCANFLMKLGVQRIRFAGPLKAMLYALGLNEEQVDGSLKEQPCDLLCGKTPRWFMQYIATEFIRDHVSLNFWVNLWKVACDKLPLAVSVVVDDVRFPNEIKFLRSYTNNVTIIELVRPGLKRDQQIQGHRSEAGGLDVDCVLVNDGTIDELIKKFCEILEKEIES
jgi:hypothetical protein